ncbi:hypothetical protein FQA39_LY05725 [Lamprigera yunnana]|nr:hypothetical protein FQA39_LY05725 [Lamprigera yunnana]
MDFTMACEIPKNSFIGMLIIFKCDKTVSNQGLYEYIKEMLEKRWWGKDHQYVKKFFTTIKEFMGYLYLETIPLTVENCVLELPTVEGDLDKKGLLNLISACYYKPFPLNNTALWDVHIGKQPLIWREKDNEDVHYFPMFFRIHHCIADGVTLIKLFTRALADFKQGDLEIPDVFNAHQGQESPIKRIVKYIFEFLKIIIYFVGVSYVYLVLKGHDNNELCRKNIGNREFLDFYVDEDGTFFLKVKEIKRNYPGTSFSAILISAYSASLNDYYKTYCSTCPDYITITVPLIRSLKMLTEITTGIKHLKYITLKNGFIYLQIKLPINIKNNKYYDENYPLISRLDLIRTAIDLMKDSAEVAITDILISRIKCLFPVWVQKPYHSMQSPSTIGSFPPGPPTFSYGNGIFTATDTIFFVPHILCLPLTFMCTTYENRLTFTMNYNAYTDAEEYPIDEILQNTYKYIDLLQKEINKKFK